jgi:hypothetical protein
LTLKRLLTTLASPISLDTLQSKRLWSTKNQ